MYAQLSVRMDVPVALILVAGGVILLVINNALVLVRIDALVHVADLVPHS